MNKTNKELGLKVNEHLTKRGIETPCHFIHFTEEEKEHQITAISDLFKQIMLILGLDLDDDSLEETPKRTAKMYVHEIFKGLDYANFPKCTTIENKFNHDEMVVVKDISLSSVCEHHFVTIDGFCTVAYIPENHVIGLSKINRIVRFFASRPQVQERLTEQIHAAICFICRTENVAVKIEATHFCVKQRGVQDQHSKTATSKLSGVFRTKSEARAEFFAITNSK